MANQVATTALPISKAKPRRRVRLICHHMTTPDSPQNTIEANIRSTAIAQNHREFFEPGNHGPCEDATESCAHSFHAGWIHPPTASRQNSVSCPPCPQSMPGWCCLLPCPVAVVVKNAAAPQTVDHLIKFQGRHPANTQFVCWPDYP